MFNHVKKTTGYVNSPNVKAAIYTYDSIDSVDKISRDCPH